MTGGWGDSGLCPDCGGPAVFSWEGIGYCSRHYSQRRTQKAEVPEKNPVFCSRCRKIVGFLWPKAKVEIVCGCGATTYFEWRTDKAFLQMTR